MTGWDSARIARVLEVQKAAPQQFASVSTDTRVLEPGALFVALAGPRFDAHDFLQEARARGATGAVVRRGTPPVDGLVMFEVADTVTALGQLARARRREIDGPVVAVSGTNGKTATKEMLAAALATEWVVHATHENLNNLIGVPLTLLAAPPGTSALVVEAGASVPGEIGTLREMIEPTIGVITNVAAGHVEGFGSLEHVLSEKVSLVRGIPVAVVGSEPPALAARAGEEAERVIVAGTDERAEVRPDRWELDARGEIDFTYRGLAGHIPLVGRHQLDNAMIALAVGTELGLEPGSVTEALQTVRLPPGRCQVLAHDELLILHDAYNANPHSLTASLEAVQALRGERPVVVVVGTMLELGSESAVMHEQMAERILAMDPKLVAAVGEFVPAFERHRATLGTRLLTAPDPASLGELLAPRLDGNEVVLLKASRGVRLEQVLSSLVPDSDGTCSTIS